MNQAANKSTAPHVLAGISQVMEAFSHEGIGKNRKNESQGFSFRGIDDVLNRLSKHLVEASLVITPRVINRDVHERINARGNAIFYVVLSVDYTIQSAIDGSSVVITTVGEAMDSGDKATNKALSVAYKYMAFQTFAIPISEDPDSETHSVRPPQPKEFVPPPATGEDKVIGEQELQTITNLCEQAGVDQAVICKAYGVKGVKELPLKKFAEIVDKLQKKVKAKKD